MKIEILFAAVISAFFTLHSALGQGALTPPGPPGPTMLTLSQIEPRTPISSAPFTITQPGSYYLTTNLTVTGGDALTIATNGVTLDLSGFTISSTAASATGNGILLNSGLTDITICNGHIRGGLTNNGSGVYGGSGFAVGIHYSGSAPVNVLVSRISVSGCLDYGIFLNSGASTVVESCTVRTVGDYGIVASTVKGCSAMDCGYTAIDGDQVLDCRGQCSGGIGIYATTAQNCDGYSSSSYGLYAITAQNCYGISSTSYGIDTANAVNCYGSSGGSGDGLYASYVANGCFGYSYSGTGLYAFIANACHGVSATGTALSTPHNIYSY
jgi:hypothetical protein